MSRHIELKSVQNEYRSKLMCLILPQVILPQVTKFQQWTLIYHNGNFLLESRWQPLNSTSQQQLISLLEQKHSLRFCQMEGFRVTDYQSFQNTQLCYILSGSLHSSYIQSCKHQCHVCFAQTGSLHHMMKKFWSTEKCQTRFIQMKKRPARSTLWWTLEDLRVVSVKFDYPWRVNFNHWVNPLNTQSQDFWSMSKGCSYSHKLETGT